MEKGKLIVIEGTDSSGKETQAIELVNRLNNNGIKAIYKTFPNYDSATGKIVGGPYLGKEAICEGWFSEGAANVDPIVSSCYFGADRRYNMPTIQKLLDDKYIVILDRYVDSNLAHQGGKEPNKEKRLKIYKNLEWFEYEFLELIKPDFTIFLHLPYLYSKAALEQRIEKPDQHESSIEHLKHAENAYLEIAKLHNYITIECVKENSERKTREELYDEVYTLVKKRI